MKYLFFSLITLTLFIAGCKTQRIVNEEKPKEEIQKPTYKLNEFGMPILLEYEPSHISLGKVPKGEKRTMQFNYKNITDEYVEIEIVTACSCTETSITKSKLNPGDTGSIDLIFDSGPKDKSEKIDVDIILKNTAPDTGYPIVDRVTFDYELVME